MKVEQIYTGCLSHAAYYIESNGEAAVFDPLREVQPYIDKALQNHAEIKYVFETHFHADFVSGHLDLKAKTGADIVFGPNAKPAYEAIVATDGQVFNLGGCTITAIHTPGHTMESTTYLLTDEDGNDHGLITGDTLFIGDVGRPDLAQHVVSELTEDKLARELYHSLRKKIMPLSDALIVYPNHGAGSACGKLMSKETTDTLGNQKRTNYALRPDMTEDEFVKEVLSGLAVPPQYFPKNVLLNINGYESLDTVIEKGNKALSPNKFEAASIITDALILDTRDAGEFAKGYVKGSINIGLNGSFATWAGEMIKDINQPILLVTDPGKEIESMLRLARVGYDNTIGYLENGFEAWKKSGKPFETILRITPEEFSRHFASSAMVIDVRKKSEYDSQHIVDAVNIPLNTLYNNLTQISCYRPFVLYCAGGYRSMIAASIIRRLGYTNFVDVEGGIEAIIKETAVPSTAYIKPVTLL